MSPCRQSTLSQALQMRAAMLMSVRRFFQDRDYLEVETPIRIPAPAPEAHIDAVASEDWFLQTSPELCMKHLLASGYERIFQVARCFRSRERGRSHIPELTLLEWYTAGQDYTDIMDQTADLIRCVARDLKGKERLAYQGRRMDLSGPWRRMTVAEAFRAYSDTSLDDALASGRFDEIVGLQIEPRLGLEKPVFLCDYPAQMGALARLKPQDPRWAERFELYIAGLELCNGFSELTDPGEQRRRFQAERADRKQRGKPLYPMPERFLEVLVDMPAAAGNALGIDRLAMLLTDSRDIADVVAFVPEEL